jgi:hypothetical protein
MALPGECPLLSLGDILGEFSIKITNGCSESNLANYNQIKKCGLQ